MGNRNSHKTEVNWFDEMDRKINEKLYKDGKVNKNSFKFNDIIGKGGLSVVWKVTMKKDNKIYALKEMSKVKIIDTKSANNILFERDLLSKMNHP
jgi:serine/threonine kinase 32